MKPRRFALALAAVALAAPATAFAQDGTATIAKQSTQPQVAAMRVDVVLRTNDPNLLAETVGYQLTGLFAVTLLGGVSTELPEKDSPFSDLGPSVVTADQLASLLTGLWDRSTDPTLTEALNSLGGDVFTKGHKGVTATLTEQLDGIVKMLGLGPATAAPPQQGADSNAFVMPGWELYADGEEGTDDTGLTPPPLVSINEDGSDTVHNGDGSTVTGEPGDPKEWKDPSKPEQEQSPSAEKVRDAIIDAVKSVKSAAETYTSMPVYIGVTIKGGKEEGLPTMGGITININLPPYNKYVDPDSTGGSTAIALSPEEVAARLTNELKDPVNPLDVQEAPPGTEHGTTGADPTLELHDPDSTAGTLAPVTDPADFHATDPIDYHPDAVPLTPETNPAPTGDEPPRGDG